MRPLHQGVAVLCSAFQCFAVQCSAVQCFAVTPSTSSPGLAGPCQPHRLPPRACGRDGELAPAAPWSPTYAVPVRHQIGLHREEHVVEPQQRRGEVELGALGER